MYSRLILSFCFSQIGDEGSILPSKLFQFLEGKLGASVITSEYSKKASAKKGSSTSKADELVVNTFMTFFAYLYGECLVCVCVRRAGGLVERCISDMIKENA